MVTIKVKEDSLSTAKVYLEDKDGVRHLKGAELARGKSMNVAGSSEIIIKVEAR